MPAAPPKFIETIVSRLLPPACREEVLGDLSEICTSTAGYIREAIRVVPLVVLSRIRRTADPLVVLMEATALYLFFVGAAWCQGNMSLLGDGGLLRLAIPPAWVLFGLIVDEAYANPGKPSIRKLMRGPLLGVALASLSQLGCSAVGRTLALPPWIMFYGCAAGMSFSVVLKALFPPVTDQQLDAGAPALWLKQNAKPLRIAPEAVSSIKTVGVALVLVLFGAFIGAQIGGPLLCATLVFLPILLMILRELRRW